MSQIVWQKSSFSGTDANRDCVELAPAPGGVGAVLLRESDAPAAVVAMAPAGLRALLSGIKAGQFDDL